MNKFKRGYLNSNEEAFFMMSATMLMFLTGDTEDTKGDHIVKRFESAGMLTSSSKKNLKSGLTFTKKFVEETYNGLDEQYKNKLKKRLDKFWLKFVTEYDYKIFMRDIADKQRYTVIEKNLFKEVVDILGQECVNCDKDYRECKLYNVLADALVSSCGECTNCPYACKL